MFAFRIGIRSGFNRASWIGFRSKRPNSTQIPGAKKPKGIKLLMQEYGYSALGVYFALSCIDLPITFLMVHSAGEEAIKEYQDQFLRWIGWRKGDPVNSDQETGKSSESGYSTLWTEFAVAYAIHKSLIFIRLPITAAITPAVVSKLRKMGFNVGKITSAARQSVGEQGIRKTLTSDGLKNLGKNINHDPAALNPKFGKPPSKGQRWFF
ncbi:hypothetical protein KL905_001888 [Ogataea polymorpha]|uniref:DUF1279 domain-containing protein n=1 Tax=Ogataea polymorpha TaxID=460523 RepID=A0A1B7SEA0_9ASCO|nr:uncharacterized protein OGAPODRAFT_94659 [Ogataea polymorpha]KAG7883187.1 hypothetical protein KL937_000360 [Ogataea polymorpha]KAG7895874.1 hypothetical protein KL936_000582 [Ogataea polymorpha]KAG7896249.1 hypothetical protein KL908_000763 [Ogataea polymorpha]KAG7904049.1 hypothetical protein KL935_000188 [Ogataea polymorpha]KAG7908448.1 hypothetical protein KL907_001938 [Ogataea polymorpha]